MADLARAGIRRQPAGIHARRQAGVLSDGGAQPAGVHGQSDGIGDLARDVGGATRSEERAVLRSTGRENMPVWSPDGTRIANVSDQTGSEEIFMSDAGGQNRVQITHFNGPRLGRLRWSPDGKTLIFDFSTDHGWEVFTVGGGARGRSRRGCCSTPATPRFRTMGSRSTSRSRGADLEGDCGRRESAAAFARSAARRSRWNRRTGSRFTIRARRRILARAGGGRRGRRGVRAGARFDFWSTTIQPAKKGDLLRGVRA